MSEIGAVCFANLALALAGGICRAVSLHRFCFSVARRGNSQAEALPANVANNDRGNDDTFNGIRWIRTGICRRGRVCGRQEGRLCLVMGRQHF